MMARRPLQVLSRGVVLLAQIVTMMLCAGLLDQDAAAGRLMTASLPKPAKYDKRRCKRRNRIEIMVGRLKDWRWVATRYDRCPKVFLSAVALAATVMSWL